MSKKNIPMRQPRAPHTAEVEVSELRYRLQHPGTREWVKLQQTIMNMQTRTVDLVALMDYCFEHVVHPHGHDFQPNLDEISPAEAEVWGKIFLPFLRGDSVAKFAPKKVPVESEPGESGGVSAEAEGGSAQG